jgi:serine/threonine protein kinase
MMLCPGFKTIRRLGEGGFGVVYLAEREKDKQVWLSLAEAERGLQRVC